MNHQDLETFNVARTLVKLCERIDQIGFPTYELIDACADKVKLISNHVNRRASEDKSLSATLANRDPVDKGEPVDLVAKALVEALSKDKMTAAFDACLCLMQRFTNFYLTVIDGYNPSNLPVWKPTV